MKNTLVDIPYVIRKRGVDNSPFYAKGIFTTGVNDALVKAGTLFKEFDMDISKVLLVYVNQGRAAGRCRMTTDGRSQNWNLEFNTVAIGMDWDHMFYETIPHEVAHLVTNYIFGVGAVSVHGREWKRIVRKMGGDGGRCHSIPIPKSRDVKKMTYIATCGTRVEVTIQVHRKIQCGQVRMLTSTKGKLHAGGWQR